MKGKPTKLQLTVNVVEWMRKMIMTLDKMEKALKHSVLTKVATRPHEKRTTACSQLQAVNKLASGVHELARVNV